MPSILATARSFWSRAQNSAAQMTDHVSDSSLSSSSRSSSDSDTHAVVNNVDVTSLATIAHIFQFQRHKSLHRERPPALVESLPLSLFYHADEHLIVAVKRLKRLSQQYFQSPRESHKQSLPKATERMHRTQKLLLDTLYLLQQDLDSERAFHASRAYRRALPREDQRELDASGYSENILFAAQALAHGYRIRGIEAHARSLRAPAIQLCAALEAARHVLHSQALLSCQRPYPAPVYGVLADLDRSWMRFEKRLCFCYCQQSQVPHGMSLDDGALMTVLMSETLVRGICEGRWRTEDIEAYEPWLMWAVPRLALIVGLIHMPDFLTRPRDEEFDPENEEDEDVSTQLDDACKRPPVGAHWFGSQVESLHALRPQLANLSPDLLDLLEYRLVASTRGDEDSSDSEDDNMDMKRVARMAEEAMYTTRMNSLSQQDRDLLDSYFKQLAALADALHGGVRARDFVAILSSVFRMHQGPQLQNMIQSRRGSTCSDVKNTL